MGFWLASIKGGFLSEVVLGYVMGVVVGGSVCGYGREFKESRAGLRNVVGGRGYR
jgi:hypothetical protein